MTATITINNQLNGIEVKFDSKPIKETLESLKSMGFRWHNKKKLWYAKQTPERLTFAENIASKKTTKQEIEKSEKINKYGVKVGDILYDSWGYEQTNVDFYEVIEILSPCKVKIVELGHIRSDYESHGMACKVMPDKNNRIGEPIEKMVCQSKWEISENQIHININSSITLRKWNGKAQYCSWYY